MGGIDALQLYFEEVVQPVLMANIVLELLWEVWFEELLQLTGGSRMRLSNDGNCAEVNHFGVRSFVDDCAIEQAQVTLATATTHHGALFVCQANEVKKKSCKKMLANKEIHS